MLTKHVQESTVERKNLTESLIALQQQTAGQPYSIVHRINLAKAYKDLGYPDLAIGDSYKALLLVDEVLDEGEYHDEALDAAERDCLSERMANMSVECKDHDENQHTEYVVEWAQTQWSRKAYVSLHAT